MKIKRYAQINSDGYVISDSFLSGEVIAENMIEIAFDFDLQNKKYVDGNWVEYIVEVEEIEENESISNEELLLSTNLNVEYLVLLKELGL